jgi:hypothetical protein
MYEDDYADVDFAELHYMIGKAYHYERERSNSFGMGHTDIWNYKVLEINKRIVTLKIDRERGAREIAAYQLHNMVRSSTEISEDEWKIHNIN